MEAVRKGSAVYLTWDGPGICPLIFLHPSVPLLDHTTELTTGLDPISPFVQTSSSHGCPSNESPACCRPSARATSAGRCPRAWMPEARARTGPRSVEKVVNGYADFQMSSKNCSPGYMERVAAWLPGAMTPGLAELFV